MTFDLDRFVACLEKRRDEYRKRHVSEPRFHLDHKATEIDALLALIERGEFDIEVQECEEI